jgi:hypothetical protein
MLIDGIQRCLEDRDETERQGRAVAEAEVDTKPEILNVNPDPEPVPEETFGDLGNNESSLIISTNDEFKWFRQGTVVAECVRQGRRASSVFF